MSQVRVGQAGHHQQHTTVEVLNSLIEAELGEVERTFPIVEGLKAYAEAQQGTDNEPIFLLQPSAYVIEWPFDTPTATVTIIGGGGGGGMGDTLPGEDGENGLADAAFLFPTNIPTQRSRERTDGTELNLKLAEG